MRRYILFLLFIGLVISVAWQNVFAQEALSGTWDGTGQTTQGNPFEITIVLQDDALTSFLYRFPGKDGLICFGVAYTQIPVDEQPKLVGDHLTATLGSDVDLTADFNSDQTTTGHLIIHWHDRQPRCNGDYELDWTAQRRTEITPASKTPSKPAPVHPFQTLFQILIFGLSNGAVLALNAIGVTLIYGTVRTMNLAHGDVFALTSALVTSLINLFGVNPSWSHSALAVSLLLILLASATLGAILSVGVEQFGFKPFRGRSRLAPMIATLGLSFILYQGALVWRTFQHSWIPGEHRSVPGLPEVPTDGIPNLLPEINLVKALGFDLQVIIRFADVFVVVMAIIFVILATWFLQKSRTGRAMRALSQNHEAAQLLGVNVNQTITRAFAVGGAFAGSAAFIFALYYGRPFGAHGAQSGLIAFAAALLGGIGSPVGALISGLTIGIVSSLSDYYFSAQWTPVLLLTLLMLMLAWRPTGLASREEGSGSTSVQDAVMGSGSAFSRTSSRLLVILLITFAIVPLIMQYFNMSGQTILRNIAVFALLTIGLNLALGLAGLLDFGFAAGFGVGAYAAAILARSNFLLVLLASLFCGALIGFIKGGLAKRLRDDFFAVATLTFGLLARQVIVNLKTLTGGSGGLGGFAAPHFLTLKLISPTMKFYLVFGFVLLTVWIAIRLIYSRTGRAWIASSADESASLALGVNVDGYRMRALMISSALAAVAGALFSSTFSYVDPEITMSFHVSSLILTMVILGGAGNIPGAILGAAGIVLYDKVIVNQIADWVALIWPTGVMIGSAPDIRGAAFFNFGIVLYLTVLFRSRKI